jgi:O-6-methylguanine DNA methyltransferase
MSGHLSETIVSSIIGHRLGIKQEKMYFQHWQHCSGCRHLLFLQMTAAGFKTTTSKPESIYLLSGQAGISYYVLTTDRDVLAISFDCDEIDRLSDKLNLHPRVEPLPPFAAQLIDGIDTYLKTGQPFQIPLINTFFIDSAFKMHVLFWTFLVPFGTVVSYSDIATWCERPKAYRAVGSTLHYNPLPLVIPCHRIIGKNGHLTGFGGGLPLKKQLLSIEQHYPGSPA